MVWGFWRYAVGSVTVLLEVCAAYLGSGWMVGQGISTRSVHSRFALATMGI